MDISTYHELADEILELLEEAIIDADADEELTVQSEEGVLTITLPEGEEYVINKHPPSKQIWVSSPISGSVHFAYDEEGDDWLDLDEEQRLLDFVAGELDEIAEIAIET